MKIFLLMAFVCLFYSAQATYYYFSSSSGDDARSTTQAKSSSTPWKSIAKLNSIFSTLQPGDKVLLKRGDTFYGSIVISKSGTSSAPITIGAYGSGDKPVITGFASLTNWVSLGSGRYESYNASLGSDVKMVSVNGAPKERGRYPNSNASNKGYLTFESHGTSSITDKELTSSPNWTGAEVVIRTEHWVLDRLKVTGHSGGTLTYSPAATYTPKNGYGYFIQNDVRTLDQLGEWSYKASTKKLSIYYGSSAPSGSVVKASVVKDLIYLNNQDNIVFDNLSLTGANENAIDIYSSINTRVQNCDINFSGINAIWATNTTSLLVENCTISNSNSTGIFLEHNTNSSIIRNNTIENTGTMLGMGENGANTSIGLRANGDKNLLEYNTIEKSGYCGIRFTGNYTVLKNNLINYFALTKDDAGGIYTGVTDGQEMYGRKIIGNIVLNGIGAKEGTTTTTVQQVSGIYLDNYSSGVEVSGNTVANCGKVGLYVHNAFKINIFNNTLYNNNQAQSQLNHDRSNAPSLRNIIFKDNICFSKTSTQPVAQFYTRVNDIAYWGKLDSNFYARPIDDKVTVHEITGLYTSAQLITKHTLEGWKLKYTMHDKITKKSPKTLSSTVNPDDYIRFEYNASKSSKTVALSGSYVDARNKSYTSGSITLAPYSSAVLIKTSTTTTSTSTSPVVAITSPTANANFAAPASVTITAAATDADGTISKVEFYRGTTLIKTESSAPYSWTWSSLAAGTYSITAKAYDNSGKNTTSSPVTFTVGSSTSSTTTTTAPVVKITSPLVDANYDAPASVTVTATASDADGTISKVLFYNGTTLIKTESTAPYSWTWSSVAAGTYNLTAKAYDNSGKVTTSSAVKFTVGSLATSTSSGSTAPSVKITSPTLNANFGAPASVTLTASATDGDGTISKVEFYNGSSLIVTEKLAPYSWTWSNVAAGTYKLTAKAYDNSGKVTTSSIVTFTVGSTSPVVAITSPKLNSSYGAPASVTVTATATDGDGTISKVLFYNGTTLLKTESTAPYSWTWSNVKAGTYKLTAKAYDNSGKSTTSSIVTFTVGSSLSAAETENIDDGLALRPPTMGNTELIDFRLFPNPAVDKIQVEFNAYQNSNKANLVIQNAAGSTMKNIPVVLAGNIIEVDISSLSSGMYVLSISTEKGIISKKFIKGN